VRHKLPLLAAICLLARCSQVAAADFVVTNTNSSGTGSLFQAITDANADAGQDAIAFNIPGASVHVIDIGATALPELNFPVLIDGYTQPGSHPNTLAVGNDAVILIHIKGRGVVPSVETGFVVKGGNTRIRGLAVTGFFGGIRLDNPLGGNVIQGNFIGVDPSGQTADANELGISVLATGTKIGGSAPAERNVVSGNRNTGINISGPAALVAGNYIGTDATGTHAIPNAYGITVINGTAASPVVIGGTDGASANVISGNVYAGVQIGITGRGVGGIQTSIPAHYVTVTGNLIGTTADGLGRLGNLSGGITIVDSDNNTIGGIDAASGNVIAFNSPHGIMVQSVLSKYNATGNRLLTNRIYGNQARGIVLSRQLGASAPVPNDPNDTDTGPNNFQNYPIITSSSTANGIATINGTLNSTSNAQFTLQFFADSQNFTTPGQTYLGSTSVTTDANGNATFSVTFPIGETNVLPNANATSANGDTSEFFYNPARLVNISTRIRVQAGDNVLIGGFIMPRDAGFVILRALGPSLSTGGIPAADRLQDPILDLYDSTGTLLGENDNWRDDPNSSALGSLAPTNDLESAMVKFLNAGAYTVIVRGKNNTTGIGLVEAYLNTTNTYTELANISTRGLVETGDNVMIGGFIATESNGPTRFVIRAIGPSLGSAGISNPLSDPTLELHDGHGAVIATNDNWKEGDEAAVRATGLAPKDDAESVILATLPVGAYTAIVRGKANATGVALAEVYNLH
jgi:hypothetical protein